MSGFDALEVTQTSFRVELVHPKTGLALLVKEGERAGEQAYIEVDGYNSPAGEGLKKAALQRAQRSRKGFRQSQADLDTLREENAEALALLTRSWLLVDFNGVIIADECNRANAHTLYANPKTAWIAAQVGEALAEEANFIQA